MVIHLKESKKVPYLELEAGDLCAEIHISAIVAETSSVRKMIRMNRIDRPSEHVERFAYIFPDFVQGEKK